MGDSFWIRNGKTHPLLSALFQCLLQTWADSGSVFFRVFCVFPEDSSDFEGLSPLMFFIPFLCHTFFIYITLYNKICLSDSNYSFRYWIFWILSANFQRFILIPYTHPLYLWPILLDINSKYLWNYQCYSFPVFIHNKIQSAYPGLMTVLSTRIS